MRKESTLMTSPAATSGLSIASLVFGVLAVPSCGLAAIAGVITGHLGLREIRKSGGAMQGRGLAVAGMVLSYTFGLIGLLIVVLLLAGLLMPILQS